MADEAGGRPTGYPPNAIHMVRTTQQAHYQLSQMADQKASILMGATFVIFTVAVSQSRDYYAPAPLLILGAFAFATAVLSMLAILPKTHPQRAGEVNLLFFGSFAGLRRDEYIDALLATMASDEEVYRTMANDIWQNGQVLARKKYRLLGYAYRVFLVGLTLSFLSFLVTLLWR
jgi:hypothetical protein